MATDPRRSLGALGEQHAAERLAAAGASILARNVRTRHGEIDLIAIDDGCLAFVEVKTLREANRFGPERPALAVGLRKQRRIRRLAAAWLAEAGHLPRFRAIRFDVIEVMVDARLRVTRYGHIRNAF